MPNYFGAHVSIEKIELFNIAMTLAKEYHPNPTIQDVKELLFRDVENWPLTVLRGFASVGPGFCGDIFILINSEGYPITICHKRPENVWFVYHEDLSSTSSWKETNLYG